MPTTLYFDLLSQPARIVYLFMKVNKIPFEEKELSLMKGEHKTEEIKKLNPFAKVPFLDDSGFTLTESVAIVKYVAGVNNVPDHWFPKDLKKQARVEEYLRWYPSNTRSACVDLFLELALFPTFRGTTPDQEKVKTYREKVRSMLKELETYFLGDKKFIAGDEISIADLFGVCELLQLYGAHEHSLYQESPVVNAWVERVKQATSPHFEDAHRSINKFHTQFGESKK